MEKMSNDELIATLNGFARAYPESMFPPLSKDELTAYGPLVSRSAAAMGRHMASFTVLAAARLEGIDDLMTASQEAIDCGALPRSVQGKMRAAIEHNRYANSERETMGCPVLRTGIYHPTVCPSPYQALMTFYQASSIEALVLQMEHHIESLQERVRRLEPAPANPGFGARHG